MPFGYVPKGAVRGLWHRIFGAPNLLRRLQWPVLEEFLALKPHQAILDLGCGDLQLSAELSKPQVPGGFVIATDVSPRLMGSAYVRRRFPRLRLLRADGARLPLADASVDRVLASSVLQMVPDPRALLRECRRVLKPGGLLVLTVPEAYCYLPRLFRGQLAYGAFLDRLNVMFGVGGAGYLREGELIALLKEAGLEPAAAARVPGRVGSFIWEASLALTYRFRDGRLPVLLAFLFYPFARLDRRRDAGCELVMTATPISE